jgi:ATP-dependent Clp protease ATP-binding subunit ClpC
MVTSILPSSLSSKTALRTSGQKNVSNNNIYSKSGSRRRIVIKRRRGQANQISAVFERFTERAIKSVMLAQLEAKENASLTEVTPSCLVIGLMVEAKDDGEHGFLKTGVSVGRAREVLKDIAAAKSASGPLDDGDDKEKSSKPAAARSRPISPGKRSSSGSNDVPFSKGSKVLFQQALELSETMNVGYIAPEHLCIVACNTFDDDEIVAFFEKLGIDRTVLRNAATAKLKADGELTGSTTSSTSGDNSNNTNNSATGLQAKRPYQSNTNQGKLTQAGAQHADAEAQNSALAKFAFDLTEKARVGQVDPVIGRESEVERCVQVLARRSKNNPILLGEPGVGKTAIAEGLAQRIVKGDVPEFLLEKRVCSLDIGLIMAGAKERGELEQRVKDILQECANNDDVILVIDEIHTMVGAGAVNGGGMDISNLMKPALARGELSCIGCTTLDEHRKYFEKDAALDRRFQPIIVEEPSLEEAEEILFGLRQRYESFHNCSFTDEAVRAAVRISARYISDRYLPDKAIDLLDEAGSRAKMLSFEKRQKSIDEAKRLQEENGKEEVFIAPNPELMSLWQEHKSITLAKNQAAEAGLFEEAATLRKRELEVTECLEAMDVNAKGLSLTKSSENVIVTDDEIAEVATAWTRVPVTKMSMDESVVLQDIDKKLTKSVIGQDVAVQAIARSLRRARCGLANENRPIASMMFAGPTGVGKTELTKALAREYFGDEEAMIRLDMSEYMERHTVSKLIGAPPGYVGFDGGGQLTEAVRKKPFSVVLFDEIEKAHPDVFNVMLQMLEDGRLTDSKGRVTSFKNTIIIITSNVGSQVISKNGGGGLGFDLSAFDENPGEAAYNTMRDKVLDEMKNFFRPEFLNRLDEIVVYRQLDEEDVSKISELMLNETGSRLHEKEIGLALTESVLAHLQKEGFDQAWGARPMRRAVQQIIDDNVAEAVLMGEIDEGETALVDFDKEKEEVLVSKFSSESDQYVYKYEAPVEGKKSVDIISNRPTNQTNIDTTNDIELV